MSTRKSPPSHGQIVRYWMSREIAGIAHPWGWFDWGEPACFACGMYDANRPIWDNDDRDPTDWQIAGLWNQHADYLDRCHVVPKCRGGSLEPSNFVLMCCECHRVSPEGDLPDHLFTWMRDCPGSFGLTHWIVLAQMVEEVS